jgi:hypothetical protein
MAIYAKFTGNSPKYKTGKIYHLEMKTVEDGLMIKNKNDSYGWILYATLDSFLKNWQCVGEK